ncbi:MFS transporter [Paenibacillus protaetiae]|uniref:MFS transporter n=2 Tax=Paenibacillus protaetiae TaxID=2509456 RepID=A0A4P6EYK0_9BACL|nr:MFS transporter [Paenibacillus protaetiae]
MKPLPLKGAAQIVLSSSRRSMIKFGLPMTPRVWHNARIDFGTSCLFSLFNVVMNQFFMPFAIQQGASNLQVGLLSAAPAIGLIFSPIWAVWVEKSRSPRPFVIIPNLVGRLLLLLPAFFAHSTVYVFTAIMYQILMGIQAPAYASLVSRMYPGNVRGRLMGYVRVAMGTLMIPLAYAVGSWSDAAGPAGPLIAAAIAGSLSAALFQTLRLPKQAAVKSGAVFSFRDQWQLVSGNKALAVFLLATTFAGFGNMLANPLYQIIQVDSLKLSNTEIGYARIAYYIGLLVAYALAGRMIDRFDIKFTLTAGIAAYGIVPLIYGLWGTYPAVILGNGIQGIGEAIWDIGILSYIVRLAPGREATVFGLHLMMFGLRGTIGPLLSASLSSHVPLSALLVGAGMCGLIGTVLFVFSNRSNKKLHLTHSG